MRKTRVYINTDLNSGGDIRLEGDAAHHLSGVLRMREGETVHLFNGTGGYYLSGIVRVEKKTVLIRPLEFFAGQSQSGLNLTLAQGISRGQKMDYTVQKAVELGISRLVPLLTEFSNVRLEPERAHKRLNHWQKIIIHACEQSGRDVLPGIVDPVSLHDWVGAAGDSVKLVLVPGAEQQIADINMDNTDLTVLCGPEGGLSAGELDFCIDAGFLPVSLGPRILRTETAAMAAMVICQSLWGDM